MACAHGLINYIDTKAKCRHLKKWTRKGTFAAGVYLSEAPSPPRFLFGWSSNFVGTESGQKQSVILPQNMVSNRTQHSPPTPGHTLSINTVLWHREEGEVQECWTGEKVRGQQFTKLGRKYQHDWLYLQSINPDKYLPQSPFTGQFFYMTTFCFGVYIVHISQCLSPIAGEEARKYIPLLLSWPTTGGNPDKFMVFLALQLQKEEGGWEFYIKLQ
jgi:hypothetical protein